MKKYTNDRFLVLYQQAGGTKSNDVNCRIIIDRETGVNYLYSGWGYGGGLTPLLDAEGKPVITPLPHA